MATRNGFKKLIENIKKNALYKDENGEYTKINSSVNRKGLFEKRTEKSKLYNPPKLCLTEEDLVKIWNSQNGKCHYFDIELDMDLLYSNSPNYIPSHPLAPSVDRIDNSKDYTIDNVVICTRFANLGRCTFPYEKMKSVIDYLKYKNYEEIVLFLDKNLKDSSKQD